MYTFFIIPCNFLTLTIPDIYPFFYRRAPNSPPRVIYREILTRKEVWEDMYSNLNVPPTLGANVPPNMAPNMAPMPAPMPVYTAPAYDCGYEYAAPAFECGYGYGAPVCCPTYRNEFILVVVLFILLIIIGACFYDCGAC